MRNSIQIFALNVICYTMCQNLNVYICFQFSCPVLLPSQSCLMNRLVFCKHLTPKLMLHAFKFSHIMHTSRSPDWAGAFLMQQYSFIDYPNRMIISLNYYKGSPADDGRINECFRLSAHCVFSVYILYLTHFSNDLTIISQATASIV